MHQTPVREATRLSEISSHQWKSGIAAWLGWLFDGLELHLYTLVATPLVVHLLAVQSSDDPAVKEKSAYIQAAFLIGWAVGGAFFGRLGDLLGRSRALSLTVLTYAICTGLCAFSQNWWELMIFRSVAALGIGGEWAVGSSLLAETWPRAWRPWLAAVLQSGVNIGILFAAAIVWLISPILPVNGERYVFLIGIIPALLVFWIRKKVPEPETWQLAAVVPKPGVRELFRGSLARITWHTTVVCALSLSAWWLFIFWHAQHSEKNPGPRRSRPDRDHPARNRRFFRDDRRVDHGKLFRRLAGPTPAHARSDHRDVRAALREHGRRLYCAAQFQ